MLLLLASDCSYTLTTEANPPAGGIVLRDDTADTSPTPYGAKVDHQDSVRLEAVPNQGFVFSHWEHNGSESPILEFNMPGSKATRTAMFIPDPANIVPAGPPPTAIIDSPTEGIHLQPATRITFSGSGTDEGDGPLAGGSLIWSSNLDGQLGTGESFEHSLSSGAHVITLTATNSVAVSGTASIAVTVGDITNRLPDVTIESPELYSVVLTTDVITFTGSAHDPEDGALTGASLVWTSDVDGEIGTGESFTATLTEGDHVITLTATDSQQGERSPFIGIVVQAPSGPSPTATISSPSIGDTFLTSDSIAFSGSANDPDGGPAAGVSLVWVSNLDGELGTGASINASLSAGNHVIALDATDSEGITVSAFVGIIVEMPPNTPPVVTIVNPANGDTFQPADNIVFSGSANDPEDGPLIADSLVWASNVDGQIGTGGSFTASLSAGHHTVSLTATDSQGVVGAEFVSITVEAPNAAPTANITSPAPGETFETGVIIAFTGTGNDQEEGSLTGPSLVWSSDFEGGIGTGESFGTSLSAGTHVITLTVTDSQQAEATVSVRITVAVPMPTATPVPQAVPLPERVGGAPHLFFGSASVNGYSAPNGTVVTAWVAEFSEPVATAVVAEGQYKFSVFQYGTRSFAGRTITFKIGGDAAMQTGTWESFGAELLNLTAGP